MRSEIKVYLRATGFQEDPDQLTVEIGVIPDRVWRIGDTRKIAKGTFQENGWELCSRPDKTKDLEVHLRDVLDRIRPHAHKFTLLAQRAHAVLICVIYIHGDDRPRIVFPPDILKQMAQLMVTVDIDFYVLP